MDYLSFNPPVNLRSDYGENNWLLAVTSLVICKSVFDITLRTIVFQFLHQGIAFSELQGKFCEIGSIPIFTVQIF